MDFHKNFVCVVVGCLLAVVRVSAYFNQTYGSYSFILSNVSTDGSQGKTFTYAQKWCNSSGYALVTIPNKEFQSNMKQFANRAISSGMMSNTDHILLNGRLNTSLPGTWRWVNGQPINGVSILDLRQLYFYGYLKTNDFKIYASTNNNQRPFICEYAGSSNGCPGGLSLNGSCYRRKTNKLTWYNARNECLEEDGDLASFGMLNDSTFGSTLGSALLANTSLTEFWVGMQRVDWRWEDTGLAIKYTDWEDGSPSNNYDCLCLRVPYGTSEWAWFVYECSYTYRIICLATSGTNVTSTISISSTVASSTKSGHDISTPSLPVQPSSSTSKSSMTTSASLALPLGLGIGLGVGVILIVAIVIGVIFFKRRQKSKSNSYTGPSSSSDANHRTNHKETIIDGQYDEIRNNGANKSGVTNGNANSGVIYAAVQPSGTLLPQNNDAETQGERTVYAQFDITPEP